MRGKSSLRIQAELNGLCRGTVYLRMRKGMTKEQALKCPSLRQPVQDHEGTWFPSIRAMTRHWGVNYDTFYNRRWSCGWSLEKALTAPIHSVQDHTGTWFRSVAQMTARWGVKLNTYRARRLKGWSLEKALATPTSGAQDHEGTLFRSVQAMTQHWGVARSTFRTRLEKGWSLEDALTAPAWKRREGA